MNNISTPPRPHEIKPQLNDLVVSATAIATTSDQSPTSSNSNSNGNNGNGSTKNNKKGKGKGGPDNNKFRPPGFGLTFYSAPSSSSTAPQFSAVVPPGSLQYIPYGFYHNVVQQFPTTDSNSLLLQQCHQQQVGVHQEEDYGVKNENVGFGIGPTFTPNTAASTPYGTSTSSTVGNLSYHQHQEEGFELEQQSQQHQNNSLYDEGNNNNFGNSVDLVGSAGSSLSLCVAPAHVGISAPSSTVFSESTDPTVSVAPGSPGLMWPSLTSEYDYPSTSIWDYGDPFDF
ncbi:OLC1v1026853C1 [Oldenlandia corymbosa var. corymbosa]|uniref:OLC1v1026853C1 n=1 Tax=Oldenlandia corymbosa var. corymbosa TaxID=529605 RepID=A0AAV1C8L1_OLDCO|nr:OLC1v1026853C1 [Oldenlandia corymbosa var. corymbosa]